MILYRHSTSNIHITYIKHAIDYHFLFVTIDVFTFSRLYSNDVIELVLHNIILHKKEKNYTQSYLQRKHHI